MLDVIPLSDRGHFCTSLPFRDRYPLIHQHERILYQNGSDLTVSGGIHGQLTSLEPAAFGATCPLPRVLAKVASPNNSGRSASAAATAEFAPKSDIRAHALNR